MFGSPKKLLIQQLDEARQRISELEAWKAAKEADDDQAQGLRIELSGEIMNTLRRTSSISRKAQDMLRLMSTFDANFQGASNDLGGIDDQMGGLGQSIATTGSAIYQTSAAVEQMSASIGKIAEESTTRFHDIKNLAELSKSGQEEMESTLGVIQEVTAGIDDLRSFLEIIDDIAGKTSILSMNAAIQAAHAGDVGKGFAVVADEIRRLAESSATNAAGITKKLNGLIEVIHKAEASSLRTSQILTEAEDKVSKATAGFQEIEQGAQELAAGSREMLEGVGSLRDASLAMTETSAGIARNSGAVTARIVQLKRESQALEASLGTIRADSADLNGAGMSLSQTTVKQLSVGRSPVADFDATFAAILSLQHLAWISRVRGALDGAFQVDPSTLGDHRTCDFGRWMDGQGKARLSATDHQGLADLHEKLHAEATALLTLVQKGRMAEAEAGFPSLVARSEALIEALRTLAGRMGGSSQLITWTKDFELGHGVIDAQHRGLVDLINRLNAAIHLGRARAQLSEILDELVAYTVTHFRDEEALFQSSDYPGKKGHLEQHQKFVSTAAQLQADFHAGKAVLGSETLEFLKDWLTTHIRGSDRGYMKYL